MQYSLNSMFAYRFYEQKEGPLVTLMTYSEREVDIIGSDAGIVNIKDIYQNRKLIEDLLYKMFIKAGGKPKLRYPLYAAVYNELPANNQLHVRFETPECIKIPMSAFSRDLVSFTYGQSPRALTRRDNHPTRRKLLLWDDAEKAINQFPYDENEDTWLEMQIWDDQVLRDYYNAGYNNCTRTFEVQERLSESERTKLVAKYQFVQDLLMPELFFSPYSAHGISHANRVVILAQELASLIGVSERYKAILLYCSAYHDIGRKNHEIDNRHGYDSYSKIMQYRLLPNMFNEAEQEIVRYIVENHQNDVEVAKNSLDFYKIENKENAYIIFTILKDADTLDRCRFGHIDKFRLCNLQSKKLVHFAYQLLQIYREMF